MIAGSWPVGAVEAGSLKLEEPAGILSSPEMRLKLSSVEEWLIGLSAK